MILERNVLHQEASKGSDKMLMEEFKIKCKEVRKAVKQDKKLGKIKSLSDNKSSNQAWRTARSILGSTKSMSPTAIRNQDGSLVTTPSKLATIFNNFFLDKVRLLRAQTDSPPMTSH